MYNLIKHIGNLLSIKEHHFDYQCTYMWTVILTIVGSLFLVVGQIYAIVLLATVGLSAIQDTYHGIFIFFDILLLLILVMYLIVKFGNNFPKTFNVLSTIFLTGAWIVLHVAAFASLLELLYLLLAIDASFMYLVLNARFNLKQRILTKFCSMI